MTLSSPNATLPAAGWYADPQDAAQLRWWDGSQWSTHTSPAPQPTAPARVAPAYGEYVSPAAQAQGAPAYGGQASAAQPYSAQPYSAQPYGSQPYSMSAAQPGLAQGAPTTGWQIWAIVLMPLVSLLLLFTWDFRSFLQFVLENPDVSEATLLMNPGYALMTLGSWALAAALIVFAVLDWRWLGRQGYPRRFHWAWAILSSFVYVIGRSIVVKRQAGRGLAPIWVALAVNVITAVAAIAWVFAIIDMFISSTPGFVPGIAS
ncbi:DUF2510 domain-containing protein [Microterricola pindariensis]|uniref:DUF2510 domain-containing protein n=1 Tax=Microterricola pindariensis TaxID=478010 RepID=A0ABX5AY23_9MICO|nr:DUF2510 domain-containing protein [Microterricola pindariensis]PPL19780.1 hypothetical protein GY24_03955 [Microterricola pindariensis]